jgi:ABC-2 type transport system ATP-binding protein
MTDLLQARRLARRYGEYTAVDGVSFSLARGEVLGFLGPNGAGKSTCLRMITGNLEPDAGQVLVEGVDLWREPERAKRHTGYLPELPPLYPDQRVDEYLAYCARLHRVPRGRVATALRRVKQRCGLDAVGRSLIRQLSKGYRQRVGIAQAVVHEPDILVLDEPTVGLDPKQISQTRELLRSLARDHAVLLSSHLLGEIQSLCTRVLILHRGRLVHEAPVAAEGEAMPGRWLRIALEHPPAPGELTQVAEIDAVETLEAGAFRVQVSGPESISRVARRLVEAGWGLREMTPQTANLEQVFLALTVGDEHR